MYQNIKSVNQTVLALSARCRALRKQQSITQEQLAERTKLSLSSIKRFEHKGAISLESLTKIAAVLGRLDDFDMVFLSKEIDKATLKKFDI